VLLENFWVTASPFEGVRRLEDLLDRCPDAPPALRIGALRTMGGASDFAGHHERARSLFDEAFAAANALDDDDARAILLHRLGVHAIMDDEPERGRDLFDRSLELHRAAGSRRGEAEAFGSRGELELSAGNLELAVDYLEQSLAISRATGLTFLEAGMLSSLAEASIGLGRLDDAERHGRTALVLAIRIADRIGIFAALGDLAWAAAEGGDGERAGRLWGALEAEEARGPLGMWADWHDWYDERILPRIGRSGEAARVEGRALTLEEAAAYAVADGDG
jgi:tetratricopeptide (TPR) repeat protein